MATALKKIGHPEDNFAEMAQAAIDATDGSIEAATAHFERVLLADHALIQRNTPMFVHVFASQIVRREVADRRRERPGKMSGPVATVVPIDGGAFREAVAANYDRFMSRPIYGGKAISQCTADEIYASADAYDKRARTCSREAEWQAAVAAALEKNRSSETDIVSDCLTEATLSKLWEDVSGDAA